MKHHIIIMFILASACTTEIEYVSDRHACATEGSSGSDSGSEGSSDDESSSSDGSGTAGEGVLPVPQGTCPTIEDGVVEFCVPGYPCRDALVVNAGDADGSGPLSLHWHGTYEWPDGMLEWDWATQQLVSMVAAEDGLLVLPYGDPDAIGRPNNPFPWWIVCGDVGPSGCTRDDDFVLADEIVACALEQGLVDPERLTTSGMSAGGIFTSHLIGHAPYLAAAVSWSGGVPPEYRPTNPASEAAVMLLHGGPGDVYCGTGTSTCYDFVEPSEALAADVDAAGNFSFLCDHQANHSASMGGEGAQFLALAHASGHPWEGYNFGAGGHWMLDNYCYSPGDPSPWE